MDQQAWDALREISLDPDIRAQRPDKGKHVQVITGKRSGIQGVVVWHGVGKFDQKKWRYGSPMADHFTNIQGRYGFSVRIRSDDGALFYTSADNVTVITKTRKR